jgi:hypothetical protein
VNQQLEKFSEGHLQVWIEGICGWYHGRAVGNLPEWVFQGILDWPWLSLDKCFEEIILDMSIVDPRSRIMDLMMQFTETSTRYNLQKTLQQKNGVKAQRKGLVKQLEPAAFWEQATQWLERFDVKQKLSKMMMRGSMNISWVLPFFMTATHASIRRRKASHLLPSVARRQMLVLSHQSVGKRKHEKQSLPPIRTKTSDWKSGSFQGPDERRNTTPFMSSNRPLKTRDRIFCNQGKRREGLQLWCSNHRKRIELLFKRVSARTHST